jgi:hypothetical protein
LHSYSIIFWKITLLEHWHFCSTVCSISLVLRYDNMHLICYEQDTEQKFHVVYIGSLNITHSQGTQYASSAEISCIYYTFAMNLQVEELYLFYTSHNMLNQKLTSIYVHHVLCNGHMLLLKIIYSHMRMICMFKFQHNLYQNVTCHWLWSYLVCSHQATPWLMPAKRIQDWTAVMTVCSHAPCTVFQTVDHEMFFSAQPFLFVSILSTSTSFFDEIATRWSINSQNMFGNKYVPSVVKKQRHNITE